MNKYEFLRMSRREMIRLGGAAVAVTGASALGAAPAEAQSYTRPLFCGEQVGPYTDSNSGIGTGSEPVPLSPLILDAFKQPLPIPKALAPVVAGELPNTPYDWKGEVAPGRNQCNSRPDHGGHQAWSGDLDPRCYPNPNVYHIALQVAEHKVTTGRVQPLAFADGLGPGHIDDVIDVDRKGVGRPVRKVGTPRTLPGTAIFGFSGTPNVPNSATFPGPMINAEYWHCNLIRFENQLDDDGGIDLQDYGDPERGFLTHLHNAHTACESDGNPNDIHHQFCPGEWCDNMYLNYPAGGDVREMQSFLWFHDHTHGHTGANVYKGMVGLYPIYDSGSFNPLTGVTQKGNDSGDERKGYRLPGVRSVPGTMSPSGHMYTDHYFDVEYDIPLALYDCLIDDGITPHQDWHNGCGETHPEWWGKQFFRHYPNHGFVGDVFTVNGVAYPVLTVRRRKYRLRFLGASIARCYQLMFMKKRAGQTIQAVPGLQGQYSFGYIKPDGSFQRDLGQQCFRPRQIASEGGLLPLPVDRDMWEIWPANRKEFVVDFTKFMDGTPTKDGDEFYLVNIMKMKNGRKPNTEAIDNDGTLDPEYDPRYCVPLMKIVVQGSALVADRSLMPALDGSDGGLRKLPPIPKNLAGIPVRHFELQRSGGGIPGDPMSGEFEWAINGEPWNPQHIMARPKLGSAEIWVLKNGSGGWVHPMHLHEEEHQVIAIRRAGSGDPLPLHRDQPSKEDVANLGPGEEHWVFRRFRSYVGKYVAHCHNLAHEDHAMMFGWEIIP
jgi:FtsP/CotA-like multicopper oxidase with cupredoxin domain